VRSPKQAPAAATPWRNRIVGSGEEDPTQLVGNPGNWRTHPGPQRDALRGSLAQVGWVQQILVNKRTGFVVDGHARVEEAISAGAKTVPVLYVDLTPEEERLILATLDPIGTMAGRNDERLTELLTNLQAGDPGLQALLDSLRPLVPVVGLTNPDDVPEIEPSTIKVGDLFALGDHRLMCGSAIDPENVARLLDGAQPRLLNTDPPYGVELDQTWRDGVSGKDGQPAAEDATVAPTRRHGRTVGHRNTSISGDTRADWSEAFELVPSLEVAYVWCATTGMIEVGGGLERIGFELRQQIIWAKTQAAMSRSAYNWQHEPCWYAVRKGKTASWRGSHNDTTLWEMASPKMIMGGSTEAKYDHPTQKPVEAMSRAIGHHAGDVYEPFSGSGTTIIAAEMLGRRCYAMEIDPRYVAVSLRRWEAFTGRTAEHVDG
jgi:DNA modification methylase